MTNNALKEWSTRERAAFDNERKLRAEVKELRNKLADKQEELNAAIDAAMWDASERAAWRDLLQEAHGQLRAMAPWAQQADEIDDLCRRIRSVLQGNRDSLPPLTPREEDVVCLVARGYSNNEIAEALCISYRTVQTHVAHIFDKWDCRNRAAAAALAMGRYDTTQEEKKCSGQN